MPDELCFQLSLTILYLQTGYLFKHLLKMAESRAEQSTDKIVIFDKRSTEYLYFNS